MHTHPLEQNNGGLPIAAVEQETGIGKDTLRVWEKRYGFPQPLRDAQGNRIYPVNQVEQLHMIKRLLDLGMRPRKIVGLRMEELEALRQNQGAEESAILSRTNIFNTNASSDIEALIHEALSSVKDANPGQLRLTLTQAQARLGLERFIIEVVAPLTSAVGEAWAQGLIKIHEEHLYTEVLTGLMHQAVAALIPLQAATSTGEPRVLLTTLPQELHSLGLLMVEALLTLEGCTCVSLGTQTPLAEIVQATKQHKVNVLALSFSPVQSTPIVLASLRELRSLLPKSISIWVGGSCPALYQHPLNGITAAGELSALRPLVKNWRETS